MARTPDRLLVATVLVVLLAVGRIGLAGEAMDLAQVIEAIDAAHRAALADLQTGKGTAVVRREREQVPLEGDADLEEEEYRALFWFSGEKTRTDYLHGHDGGSGARYLARVDTGESATVYDPGMAHAVMAAGGRLHRHYFREKGQDFHPETFNRLHQEAVAEFLSRMAPAVREHEVRFRDDGLLEVTLDGNRDHEAWPRTGRVVLDPAAGYRAVEFDYSSQFDRYGSTIGGSCRAEYALASSSTYPSRVEWEWVEQYMDPGRRRAKSAREHVIVEVTAFEPNCEVAGEQFTLDGMQVAPGTEVVDWLANVQYRYAEAVTDEELVGALLAERRAAQPASPQVAGTEPERAAGPAKTPDTADAATGQGGGVAAERPGRSHASVAALAPVVVGGAVVLLVLTRHTRARARGA